MTYTRPDWNKTPCTCQPCQQRRANPQTVECVGGCGCAKIKYEVCYSCGLENRFHPLHHGIDFCRAELQKQREENPLVMPPVVEGRMYIKLKDNAADFAFGPGVEANNYRRMILRLEGQWLEIETKFLFADQLNTVAVPGITESGLRIMEDGRMIADMVGDIRPERKICRWCHHHEPNESLVCVNCGRTDKFERLDRTVCKKKW